MAKTSLFVLIIFILYQLIQGFLHLNKDSVITKRLFPMNMIMDKNLEDINEIWISRRKISKMMLSPIAKIRLNKETKPNTTTTTTNNNNNNNNNNNTLIVSTFIISIGTIFLRLGGRGALIQLLGLDFIADSELKNQINLFITYFQSLDNLQYLYFFLAWFTVKLLCIDALTIVLAVSSGVLFQGLIQGTTISVLCSSISSLIIFLISRNYLKERTQQQIALRPALKAIDRACTKNGFKTVFTLRLSPILPIPVAAYNYIYGVMSVSILDFLAGITLGSIKPYMLDCYLGLFGKSLIEDSSGMTTLTDDIVLLGIVSLVIIVGLFATQIATSSWQEINQEIELIEQNNNTTEQNANNLNKISSRSSSLDFFQLFGIKDDELPVYLRTMKQEISDAWNRIDNVIQDEWKILNETTITTTSSLLGIKNGDISEYQHQQQQQIHEAIIINNQISSGISIQTSHKTENHRLDCYDDKRLINDYEVIELNVTKTSKELVALTLESIVFTFVLFSVMSKYYNIDNS